MSEPPLHTPYTEPHRLARTAPEWVFLGLIALLAFLSTVGLYRSGARELLVGLLGGAQLCIIGGFALYLWRKRERS